MKTHAQRDGRGQAAPSHDGRFSRPAVRERGAQASTRAGAAGQHPEAETAAASRFAHDFSRVPARPGEPASPPDEPAAKPRARAGRVGSGGAGGTEVPNAVHEVLESPGRPLDSATRSLLEPRFGHDFSGVRVHDDARAAASARAVHASAYTVGEHVVFGEDGFPAHTAGGLRLLAHELAHAVQQSGAQAGTHAPGGLRVSRPGDAAERQADEAAEHVARGEAAPAGLLHRGAMRPTLMRQPEGGGGKKKGKEKDKKKEKENLTSPLFKGVAELEAAYDGDLDIGPGASGESVRRIQIALLLEDPKALPKSGADGHYGPETQAAVARFQKSRGLGRVGSLEEVTKLEPDGVVGKGTMSFLDWDTRTKVSAADVEVYNARSKKTDSRFKGKADPAAKLKDEAVGLGVEKGMGAAEKGLEWGAEKISEKMVEQGKLVDNFGQIRQSPGKTKAGAWKHVGGKTRRGKFTTRGGAKPYSRTAKSMKKGGKFLDALGTAGDVAELGDMMQGKKNPMSKIVDIMARGLPLSMVAEDKMDEMNDWLFEATLDAGYEATVNYVKNCRTCGEMTEGLVMLYVTAEEYEAAFADKLLMTEGVRKRVKPMFVASESARESFRKEAGVEAPLGYAILLYDDGAATGKLAQPIAGFELSN